MVNPLFFPSVPPLAQRAVSVISGSEEGSESSGRSKPLHSHPPLLSPADSSAQFEMGTQASPAPPVRPWNQVSVAQHTQTPLRAASQREPPRAASWLALPSPSRWLIRTIRLGYAIQFARRPPKFRGVHFTSVKAVDTHVLRAEIAVLLANRAGPSCRYEVRVLQPLLHCPQEKRWVTTDLGSASFESEPSQATV